MACKLTLFLLQKFLQISNEHKQKLPEWIILIFYHVTNNFGQNINLAKGNRFDEIDLVVIKT